MTTELYQRIRRFWDKQPCGTTVVNQAPGTREFFISFDRFYETYYPYLSDFLDLKTMSGRRVVEIGLGSGYTLHRISQNARETYAVDVSLETIRLNQARARHFGLKIGFVHASATELPFADESIDMIVSIGCLHHIPDIQSAVDEIHRVLRPGGIFKGMLYNRNSYRYLVSMPLWRQLSIYFRGKTREQYVSEMYDGSVNPYGAVYSRGEVRVLFRRFEKLEFRVENFSGHDVIPYIGDLVPRNIWLSTLGKVAGLDLYFMASKS